MSVLGSWQLGLLFVALPLAAHVPCLLNQGPQGTSLCHSFLSEACSPIFSLIRSRHCSQLLSWNGNELLFNSNRRPESGCDSSVFFVVLDQLGAVPASSILCSLSFYR